MVSSRAASSCQDRSQRRWPARATWRVLRRCAPRLLTCLRIICPFGVPLRLVAIAVRVPAACNHHLGIGFLRGDRHDRRDLLEGFAVAREDLVKKVEVATER